MAEIRGYDASGASGIQAAEENIQRAGLTGKVRVTRKELAQFVKPTPTTPWTMVWSSPIRPHGERLGEQESLRHLYAHLGERLREQFQGWRRRYSPAIPISAKTVAKVRSHKQYQLWNGMILAQLLLFEVKPENFVDAQRSRRW